MRVDPDALPPDIRPIRAHLPDPAHVGRELIHLVDIPCDACTVVEVPQIADVELVSGTLVELGRLDISAPHPVAAFLEVTNHVTTDEATGSRNECSHAHRVPPLRPTGSLNRLSAIRAIS